MKPDPAWIPLHHREMLLATSHLSGDALGAYMRLFMHACDNCWLVPLDEEELRSLCGMTGVEWRKVRTQVLPLFKRTDKGYLHATMEVSL